MFLLFIFFFFSSPDDDDDLTFFLKLLFLFLSWLLLVEHVRTTCREGKRATERFILKDSGARTSVVMTIGLDMDHELTIELGIL